MINQQQTTSSFLIENLLASANNSITHVQRILGLKQRYFLTRQNRLRLRYSVSAIGGAVLVLALYAGGQINPQNKIPVSVIANSIEPSIGTEINDNSAPVLSFILKPTIPTEQILNDDVLDGKWLNAHRDGNGQIRRDPSVIKSAELAEKDTGLNSPAAEEKNIKIGKGETLAGALLKAGLDTSETQNVVTAISKHFNLRELQQGQELSLTLEPADTQSGYVFSSLSFAPDPLRRVDVVRNADDEIIASLDKKKVNRVNEAREVKINGSVYASADKADLPDRITASTIKLFSYAVDFQRDIKSGDKLQVMYDTYKTDDGYIAKTGDIVFAKMTVGGREYALYRHQSRDGQVDYYTADGKSIRKSTGLMRTPVAFGRMSSGFGMRVHPVIGYTKMHKGVDFAAPTGTPIYAAGTGIIERAGRFSTYGNYVRIRHSSKLSTAYAHMSKFANGIRPGVKIKQGQLIGYVGSTGRSTGAHLHYEVMVNNVQVNPSSVKFTTDNTLKGDELQRFKKNIRSMGQQYAKSIDAKRDKLALR